MNDVVFLNNHQVAQRKSEIFKRITAKKLKLLLESEPLDKSIVRQNNSELANSLPMFESLSIKEQLFSSKMNRDFLVVDLREQEEYLKFHIREAISIPSMFFNQDRIPSDIIYYVR